MNNKELFLGYVSAYNAIDVTRMLSFFADDCVFENISGGKLTVRTEGKVELEALARKSAEAFAERAQQVVSLIAEGSQLAAEIDYRGVLRKDLTPEMKAGSLLALRGVSVCRISGGKIARLCDYS